MDQTRTEHDSMGTVQVPADALWGAQTARAIENFPISGWRMPREFIAAMGLIKQTAARVHREAGRLDKDTAEAIIAAAQEVIDGQLDGHFPVDTFQTGSGTSSNMNANEVIAHRAIQILGRGDGDGEPAVHPNDHVNMGQSSNDVIPTALHIAAATMTHHQLVPALRMLRETLEDKARQFDRIVKIGRTHLMDAVPMRLGQQFRGYAGEVENLLGMLGSAVGWLCELPLGGTAVGSGLNAPEGFAETVCMLIAERTNLPFRETASHFEAQGAKDAALLTSGVLRNVAIALGRMANDIRLEASGPRCGLAELKIPPVQPGSSIMPGKVNPVICEAVIQVGCQVVGCDASIAAGATGGVGSVLELNVAMPMITANLLTAIRLLTNATTVFDEKCLRDLAADEQRCRELVDRSLALVTALAPEIGYDKAAEIAREAYESGRTLREVAEEKQVLPAGKLDELLNPENQVS